MNFLSQVLVTDEACFAWNGILDSDMHMWSDKNLHLVRETHFQHQFTVDAWVAIIGDFLTGPYELPT